MDELIDLENRLKVVEARIDECRRRMPAHSVKPDMMGELMDLEDERDRILSKLQIVKGDSSADDRD